MDFLWISVKEPVLLLRVIFRRAGCVTSCKTRFWGPAFTRSPFFTRRSSLSLKKSPRPTYYRAATRCKVFPPCHISFFAVSARKQPQHGGEHLTVAHGSVFMEHTHNAGKVAGAGRTLEDSLPTKLVVLTCFLWTLWTVTKTGTQVSFQKRSIKSEITTSR